MTNQAIREDLFLKALYILGYSHKERCYINFARSKIQKNMMVDTIIELYPNISIPKVNAFLGDIKKELQIKTQPTYTEHFNIKKALYQVEEQIIKQAQYCTIIQKQKQIKAM